MSGSNPHTGRRTAFRVLGGLLIVLVLLAGALHLPAVQTSVIRAVLDRVQPAGDSRITLGRSSGSPFNRMTLTDVGLSTPNDSTRISVDSITVRMNPLKLLGSTIRLGGLDVRGVSFDIATRPDGALVLPQTEPSADTTAGRGFALGRFNVGRVEGRIGAPPDSVLVVEAFDLSGSDLSLGESFSVTVDTLLSRFRSLSEGRETPTGSLRLGADLRPSGQMRAAAELVTPRSNVSVRGTARYVPDSGDDLPIVDVNILGRASPFSLADVTPFLPQVNANRVLEFDVEATGDASELTLDLSLRDDLGGRAELSGMVRSVRDSKSVSAAIRLASVDAADWLSSDSPLPSIAGADLTTSLSGPSWSRLDGRFALEVEQLLTAGVKVDALRLDSDLIAGHAEYELDLSSGRGRIQIEGRARPLGTDRFVEWGGSFEGLTEQLLYIANEAGTPPAPSESTGFLLGGTMQGRLDIDSTAVTGRVTSIISDSRVAACRDLEGQIRVDLGPSRTSVQAALSPCASAPPQDGTNASPRGSGLSLGLALETAKPSRPWTARIRTGSIDLAPFLALDESIVFGGIVEASGTLPPGSVPTFDARLDLVDVRAAGAAIDSVRAHLSGTQSRMRIDAVVADDGGRMMARGRLDLAERTTFDIERSTFRHFDITRAAGITDQRIVLNGSLNGRVDAQPGALPNVDLTLLLDSTIVNQTTFESIEGQVRTSGTTVTADVDAVSWASRFMVDGTADFRGDSLRTAEGRLDVEGLDVGSLLAIDDLTTRLSGSLNGSFDVGRSPRIQAELALADGSSINRFAVEELTSRIEGSLDRLGGDLRLLGSSGSLRASFGYSGERLFVDGHAANLPVHELLGDSTNALVLSTDLVLNASSDSSGWNTMTVDLDSLRGRWNSFDVDRGTIRVDVTPARAEVDTFFIAGQFGRIRVSGITPLSARGPVSNLRMDIDSDATLGSIPVLRDLGIGLSSLEAQGALRGPFERRRLNLSVDGAGLRYGTYAVTTLEGRVLAELDAENSLRSAEITTSTGVIDLGTMQLQSVRSTTTFDGKNLDTTMDATVDDDRSVSVGVTWYRDMSPQVIELNRLRASFGDDRWQLAGPGRVTLGDPPRIDGLVWYSADQRIVISSADRSGFVQHFATIDSFKIDAVADLLGFQGLGGRLSGVFSTARQDTTTILQGNASAFITAFGRDVGEMAGRLSVTETGVQLSASMTHETGKQITVSGTIPPTAADEQLRVRADADGFPIAWVRAFIDPELVSDLEGSVEGRVEISGTAAEPDWYGSLTLTNGMIGIPELGKAGRGLRYSNIRASVEFDSDRLTVTEFRAASGGGRVTGTGSARLGRFTFEEFDIDFEADGFLAINNESYRAVTNGTGRLRGSLERPVFSGNITVPSADFYLNDETTADAFEPVTLSDEDLRTLRERFGVRISAADTSSFDFYRAMKIENLRVRLERDTWVRSTSNPEMDIQITGDLDVSKEHNSQESSVFGTIQVLPARSRIIQFGRRFNISAGTLTFNGPAESPRMDLEAEYDVPSRRANATEVTIRLLVTGTPQDLEVEFQSEPQMELADIVSYIATGRPASESLQIGQNQSGTYLQSAAGIAIGQVRDLIQDLAGQNLGLDVIEITQNSTQGMTVTAGKYVTPEFYVAVSQPLSVGSGSERSGATSESTTQVAMEYEIVQQLLLSLMNRGTILRVTLRWEYAF